jgi:hypothetical protein
MPLSVVMRSRARVLVGSGISGIARDRRLGARSVFEWLASECHLEQPPCLGLWVANDESDVVAGKSATTEEQRFQAAPIDEADLGQVNDCGRAIGRVDRVECPRERLDRGRVKFAPNRDDDLVFGRVDRDGHCRKHTIIGHGVRPFGRPGLGLNPVQEHCSLASELSRCLPDASIRLTNDSPRREGRPGRLAKVGRSILADEPIAVDDELGGSHHSQATREQCHVPVGSLVVLNVAVNHELVARPVCASPPLTCRHRLVVRRHFELHSAAHGWTLQPWWDLLPQCPPKSAMPLRLPDPERRVTYRSAVSSTAIRIVWSDVTVADGAGPPGGLEIEPDAHASSSPWARPRGDADEPRATFDALAPGAPSDTLPPGIGEPGPSPSASRSRRRWLLWAAAGIAVFALSVWWSIDRASGDPGSDGDEQAADISEAAATLGSTVPQADPAAAGAERCFRPVRGTR